MIFSGWNFMRIVRLIIGIFIGANAMITHDALSGLISGIFLFQAFTNTGCCCTSNCSLPLSKNNKQEQTETIFQAIKKD